MKRLLHPALGIVCRTAAAGLLLWSVQGSTAHAQRPDDDGIRLFRTNGNTFVFMTEITPKQKAKILYAGSDRVLHEAPIDCALQGADVTDDYTIHACYYPQDENSILWKCDLEFRNCEELLRLDGMLHSPVFWEERNQIIFTRSERNKDLNRKRRFTNDRLAIYDIATQESYQLKGGRFYVLGDLYNIYGTIYLEGGYYSSESSLFIDGDVVISYNNSIVYVEEESFDLLRNKVKLAGNSNLIMNFKFGRLEAFFLRTDPGGGFIEHSCILRPGDKLSCMHRYDSMNPPDVHDGILYLGDVDLKAGKAIIQEIKGAKDAGEQ